MKRITCPCGTQKGVMPSQEGRKKYCSKVCFYKYRTRPSGLVYSITSENKGWFKKGQETWNKGKKLHYTVWNKGKGHGYINHFGYRVVCIDGYEILEHRKVMEDYLGRKIDTKEIVHHVNEDRQDNRIDNLRLMTRSEHTKLHNKLRLCV